MKMTPYFRDEVPKKHREFKLEWVQRVLDRPLSKVVEPSGRIRLWGQVPEFGNRYLRVVLLSDGETVHNAFFDRNFKPPQEGRP